MRAERSRDVGEELIEIALGRFQPLRGALQASKMLRIL